MYRYEKLLVALNLAHANGDLVSYTGMVAKMAGSKIIRFISVRDDVDLDEALLKQHPELRALIEPDAHKELKEEILGLFEAPKGAEVQFEFVSGDVLKTILENVRSLDADLVLVGRHRKNKFGGTLGERLARKAHCSVITVPDATPPKISKIVVGLAFDENCENALDVALAFTKAADAEIKAVHVYKVVETYYKTGKSYDQVADIIRKNASQRMNQVLIDMGPRAMKVETIITQDDKPFRGLLRFADAIGADLIVTAARGREQFAGFLLGSVTERLIEHSDIPVVAVKEKGEGLSFLDALLSA